MVQWQWLQFAALLFLLVAGTGVSAQEEASNAADAGSGLPSVERVTRLAEEAASSNLDEATKAALAELYRKVINNLETAADFRQATARFESAMVSAPGEASALRERLRTPGPSTDVPEAELAALPLAELEQRLQKRKADLAVAQTNLAELENQLTQQRDRPAAIRSRLAEINAQITSLASSASIHASADEQPDLSRARQWAGDSLRELLRVETLMLEQELLSQPARLELMTAQRDLAEYQRDALARQIGLFELTANRMRLQAAEVARSEAQMIERESAGKHPLIAELASRNARLTEEIDRLANAIEKVKQAKVRATDESNRIEEAYQTTRQKLEIAGLGHILGQVLQDQQRALPGATEFRRQGRERERLIAETSLSQIQLEEERRRLRDIDGYVDGLMAGQSGAVGTDVRDELTALAMSRAGLIDKGIAVQHAYLLVMAEADIAQRRLQEVVERFDAYLDKRLLWVRSAAGLSVDAVKRIPFEFAVWLYPKKWWQAMDTLFSKALLTPLVLLALLFATLRQLRRRQMLAKLVALGGNVGKSLRDRLSDTLLAFGIIALLALPWPFLMFVAGWQLGLVVDSGEFGKDLGVVLTTLAPLLLQLWALRLFLISGGVAEAHFGWRTEGVRRLYSDLNWFTPLLMVMAFVTMLTLLPSDLGPGTGLGRVLFLLLMVIFTVFFWRLSRPRGGTISILSAAHPNGRVYRLRHFWFLLLTGPPIVAALLSLVGYTYTASTMIDKILRSAWLAMLLIVLHQLIERWLSLNQQRLRIEAARARREAGREARQAAASPDEGEVNVTRDTDEPPLNIESLDATSRKLLNNAILLLSVLGLWATWREVFPALAIFEVVTLWTYTKSGAEVPTAITLSSLLLAILVVCITVVAVRQLPAFLEIALLRWLKMSPGGRYTVLTLTRYAVVAIGLIWIFGFLGGDWSQIQWIVAALGVGIGFGLQEIVANFISGLIILFERPIRIGDIVTVGDTDGVVTRIQIRATTIRNWDRKELLVPNKNFITQELLNWSLSDQTTRLLIRVGVAYGSDVVKAMQLMEEAAAAHPRILPDPVPYTVFEEFGDSALLLSLRCFIDEIEHRLRTISELNLAINKRLNEAGIEIAFPQRDIHFDAQHPIEVRLRRETIPSTD